MSTFEDYYEILQVSPSAEPEVIEGAYKKLAQKYHPDHNKNQKSAEQMQKINIAHDVLGDQSQRKLYHQEWLQQKSYAAGKARTPPTKPKPSIRPTHILFSNMKPGQSKKTSFVIDNAGGPYTRLHVSNPNSWLKITSKRSSSIVKELPLEVEIEATGLDWGENSTEYIYVELDDVKTSVTAEVRTLDHSKINSQRVAITILLVTNLTLISIFILAPFIRLFIIQNTWILFVLFSLMGALIASLFLSAKFRYGLINLFKSAYKSIQKWIMSASSNKKFLYRAIVSILVLLLIALLVYIYVIPFITQVFTTYPRENVAFFIILLFLIAILFTSRRFRQDSLNIIQSIRSMIQHLIPNNFTAKEDDPNISEWTWEPRYGKDVFTTNVWNAILNFRPSRQYDLERGYHDELYNYLKSRFHQAQSNKRKGSSQPDIHIEHIAIEVKGPTGKSDVNDLGNKVIRYTAGGHHTLLFIVLFRMYDEITPAYFKDIKDGLLKSHPEVGVITKRDQ